MSPQVRISESNPASALVVRIGGLLALLAAAAPARAWNLERGDVGPAAMPAQIEPINAPFAMPELIRPVFADKTLTLESPPRDGAIQPAIDRLAAAGGGRVVVPPGEWTTGRLELRSGVELHLEEDAVVRFSGQIEAYLPPVFTRCEGLEMMGLGGLVYAYDQERIGLTGKGTLVGPDEGPVREARKGLSDDIVDPDSPIESRVFDGQEGRHYFRPYFICPVSCRDVLVEGVTLRNGPMWNLVPIYCDRVVIRGVTVDSLGVVNGDGVNVDSSRNVLIEYCSTNTGDDCYAVKSGRNEDGMRVGRPAENVVVRNCFAEAGYGGFTTGSETAGGVRNVWVHDCLFDGVSYAAYFKTRRPRGGGGDNLLVERVRLRSKSHAVFFDMIGSPLYVGELGERLPKRAVNAATPHYRGVTLRDLVGEAGGEAVRIKGIPESPATEVVLERLDIASKGFMSLADVDGLIVRDSRFQPQDPTLRLLDTRGVRIAASTIDSPGGEALSVERSGDACEPPQIDGVSIERSSAQGVSE
ncbi:Polygalacturonase [Botrimarina colliarenosi]|uniref:Polygalacturonase n=1 Tax=Botrimarina colliarenosi TaxID=2528001 RepID=A0A5C6AE21_9BACT|nr:glycoside hydrolase family 28 protein [Botrimarina colliarenosi]TWT97666.1 Polygalacturonase [Botrimarina colliarenosi]